MTELLKSELISSQGFVIAVVIFCYHLGGRIQLYCWPFDALLMWSKHFFTASQWVGNSRDGMHSTKARPGALGHLCLVPWFHLNKK